MNSLTLGKIKCGGKEAAFRMMLMLNVF